MKRIIFRRFTALFFITILAIFSVPVLALAANCCEVNFDGSVIAQVVVNENACNDLAKVPAVSFYYPNSEPSPNKDKCIALPKNTSETTTESADESKPTIFSPPDISVSLPGLAPLKEVSCSENGDCEIPWLAQYIAALQRYGIGIVGIISTVAMMVGGVIWLSSAGNSERISQAKHIIGGSIIGLVLVFSSYIILNLVNPSLTDLKSLGIKRIKPIILETVIFNGHDPVTNSKNKKPLNSTDYDETFKAYAGCLGVDWRIFKGIAFHESGLDPQALNDKGYKGLFQTREEYCEAALRDLGESPSICKAGIYDPAVNTAIAAGLMKVNLKIIKKSCDSASEQQKINLIYYAHSSGCGSLTDSIKKYGCNIDTWPTSVFIGAPKSYVGETASTIQSLGVSKVFDNSQNLPCPR